LSTCQATGEANLRRYSNSWEGYGPMQLCCSEAVANVWMKTWLYCSLGTVAINLIPRFLIGRPRTGEMHHTVALCICEMQRISFRHIAACLFFCSILTLLTCITAVIFIKAFFMQIVCYENKVQCSLFTSSYRG
jgi:hypothetical protein